MSMLKECTSVVKVANCVLQDCCVRGQPPRQYVDLDVRMEEAPTSLRLP